MACHSRCISGTVKQVFAGPSTTRECRLEEPGKQAHRADWELGLPGTKEPCLDSSVTYVLTLDLNTVGWGPTPSAEISSLGS